MRPYSTTYTYLSKGVESGDAADCKNTMKKKLIDLDRTQEWLQSEITKRTGLYIDSSYFSKIMRGENKSPKIVAAIKEILELD